MVTYFKYCCIVQSLSHVQLCNSVDCGTPGFPVLHYLSGFAQTHVHWVNDAIQPSYLRRPLLLPSVFPCIRVFYRESALCIKWPKYWSFSKSVSNEYSGLIDWIVFRIEWFDILAVQGIQQSSPALQFKNTSSLTLLTFLMAHLWTILSKVCLCFLIHCLGLSHVSFQEASYLLISWLQSPSTVILEPKESKSITASIFSPSICYEMMEWDIVILIF